MIDHASTAIRVHVPQVKGRIELRRARTPYLGSVRFFKHMLLALALALIIIPWTILSGFFTTEETMDTEVQYRAELLALEDQLAQTRGELQTFMEGYETFVGDYEAMIHLLNQGDEEKLQLMEQLQKAETLFDFTSAYGHLYPALRVEPPAAYIDSEKTVYLTFDDGPGPSTKAVLDVLKRYDVKATFFVVGYTITGREDILRRIVEEGHNIGIHSYSHVYRDIYRSVEAYMDDFAKVSERIEEVTGIKPDIFRFPGGSMNSYNERWGNTIISEMLSRGYRYYDWNVGSGDASTDATVDMIYEDVLRQVHAGDYSVVLLHDGGGGRAKTVEALSMVIDKLKREGYHFDKLSNQIRPTVYAPESLRRG